MCTGEFARRANRQPRRANRQPRRANRAYRGETPPKPKNPTPPPPAPKWANRPPLPHPQIQENTFQPIFRENIPPPQPHKLENMEKLKNGHMGKWKIGKTLKNGQKKEGPKTMLEMTAAKF